MTLPQNPYNTAKSIDSLLHNINCPTPARKVIETALQEVKERLNNKEYEPRHCGLIAEGIYTRAKVRQKQIYRDTNYQRKDCGTHHANPEMMKNIAPGDWIWYNNKNPGWKGLHSAIVLKYEFDTADALVASGYVSQPIRIHPINLKECPVTRIVKPVYSAGHN